MRANLLSLATPLVVALVVPPAVAAQVAAEPLYDPERAKITC